MTVEEFEALTGRKLDSKYHKQEFSEKETETVDISEDSSIINNEQSTENENLPKKVKSGDFAVDWSFVESDSYSDKFTKISSNEKVASAIETRAKWAMNNRDATQTEELYAISLKSGIEISRITNQNNIAAVKRTDSFARLLNEADSKGDRILLIHNHPRGLPPSISDINALYGNKNVVGITVGHNGSIYYYTRPNSIIDYNDWNIAMNHFKRFSEETSIEKALEVLSSKYKFIVLKL